MSDPGSLAALYDDLPRDIDDLCKATQGLLLHADWMAAYGLSASYFEVGARETLPIEQRLRRIAASDSRPLADCRTVATRAPATCRDYALMLCSIFRHRNLPARVRRGFAAYFNDGPWEDHWICES